MEPEWIKLDSVESTNSYLFDLIKEEQVQKEIVVIADYQITGRGQGEHTWHSRKGENLLMSLLLFPAFLSVSKQFQLSKITSLAICDILRERNLAPLIKWPNDILVNHRKMAGILLEHSIMGATLSHSIVGIGLNLNQTSFPEFPQQATSLLLERGESTNPVQVGESLADRIFGRFAELREGKELQVDRHYLDCLYRANQLSRFSVGDTSFQGYIRGVNTLGELQVEAGGEIRSYGHQEIRLHMD